MSSAATGGPVVPQDKRHSFVAPARVLGFAALLLVAIAFVGKYVFRYYLNYNERAFTDPDLGAANYWVMRGRLLTHISGLWFWASGVANRVVDYRRNGLSRHPPKARDNSQRVDDSSLRGHLCLRHLSPFQRLWPDFSPSTRGG